MKSLTKKNHIFFSYVLLFLPYIFCAVYTTFISHGNFFINFFEFFCIVLFYYSIYFNEIYYAIGLHDFFNAEPGFYPLLFCLLFWLYLSYKITITFWKDKTKTNTFLLYFINSFLLSPIIIDLIYRFID